MGGGDHIILYIYININKYIYIYKMGTRWVSWWPDPHHLFGGGLAAQHSSGVLWGR